MTTFIDLSHRLHEGMPSYPGLPVPHFEPFLTHQQSAERSTYAPGTTFQMASANLGGNTGTYIDAPFHRHPGKADLARLPLDRIADLPGITISTIQEGEIGTDSFSGLDLRGKAVLIHTGWSSRWHDPDYFRSGPYLGADACDALIEAGAILVGIDCANIDNMGDPSNGTRGDISRPAHTRLLAADIPIVEHLCDLDRLPPRGYRFFAVPPPIEGGTSFAVRAFAILD